MIDVNILFVWQRSLKLTTGPRFFNRVTIDPPVLPRSTSHMAGAEGKTLYLTSHPPPPPLLPHPSWGGVSYIRCPSIGWAGWPDSVRLYDHCSSVPARPATDHMLLKQDKQPSLDGVCSGWNCSRGFGPCMRNTDINTGHIWLEGGERELGGGGATMRDKGVDFLPNNGLRKM